MVERRIFAPEGQRIGDRWLSRVGKILIIATAVATGFAFANDKLAQIRDSTALDRVHTAQIDSLKTDIFGVKSASAAIAYMVCFDFAEKHPATQVPIFCNGATRANTR